jgi:hypothetical protein
MQRFELKQDFRDSWSVVDTLTGLPVEAKGKPLQRLSMPEAQHALFMANTGILLNIANRPLGHK